jgi:hypothetical protein
MCVTPNAAMWKTNTHFDSLLNVTGQRMGCERDVKKKKKSRRGDEGKRCLKGSITKEVVPVELQQAVHSTRYEYSKTTAVTNVYITRSADIRLNILEGEINSVNLRNRIYIPYNEQNTCIMVGAVIKCDKRMIHCTSVRSSISGNGVVWASTHGGNKVGATDLGGRQKAT